MMDDFRKDILKVSQPRTHKARHSIGVYDAFKWVRKNGWFDIGRSLTEHDFYYIVRHMNNYLADLYPMAGMWCFRAKWENWSLGKAK